MPEFGFCSEEDVFKTKGSFARIIVKLQMLCWRSVAFVSLLHINSIVKMYLTVPLAEVVTHMRNLSVDRLVRRGVSKEKVSTEVTGDGVGETVEASIWGSAALVGCFGDGVLLLTGGKDKETKIRKSCK